MPRAERDPESRAYIYGLYDPRTGELRYIGQSVDPENRLRSHIYYHDNGPKSYWVRKLLGMGLKPIMSILEEIKYKNINSRERYWIHQKRQEGISLLNLTDGGDQPPRATSESARKANATRKANGYTDSPETLENKKRAQQERVARDGMHPNLYTPEANQSRSLRLKYLYETGQKRRGINLSPEAKAKADRKKSESLKGRQMATPEEYARRAPLISNTVSQRWEQGDYDYRAKTGPKSEKEGRIYPEDHQDIVDLYEAGYGVKEIATYYDVTHGSVTKLLKKLEVYKEKVDHTDEVIRLYKEGLSQEQVGKQVGLSGHAVGEILRKNSIPIRNKTSYSSLSEETAIDALRRQRNGEKVRHMAAEFGVKEGTLQERFRRLRKKGY